MTGPNNDLILEGKQFSIKPGILRVLMLRDEFTDNVSDPDAVIREVRARSLPVDLLTFLQSPPDTKPKFPYRMRWDNLAVLEVSSYEHWLKKQVHQNQRNKIRKAEKSGVVVLVEPFSDKLAAGLVDLFNETPMRRGKKYSYYGWDLEKVKREWATQLDRSSWLVAYYQEELIGFIKLIVGEQLARTSGTIAKQSHRDRAPMNALFAKAVEVCAAKGVPLLVYGKYTYGGKGEDSLTVFKRYNGFQKVEVPRYYVPLSSRGRIGMALGLHRELSEIIPRPIFSVLLKMRSKWQNATRKD